MQDKEIERLDKQLAEFLEDLLKPMGRQERQHWGRVYVQGLLLDGQRKSVEPMAQRIPGADVQALRQFVGQSPWAVEVVQQGLARKLQAIVPAAEAWIVDETGFPKAGHHSVGVARQYCGTLGKVANCQVAVSLHLSGPQASCPLNWRLYLPPEWLADPERAREVKLPPEVHYQDKPALALELLDQALNWRLPRLPVLADSFYGNEFGWREALRQRHLPYVVEVEKSTVVWKSNPEAVPLPRAQGRGRPRRYAPKEALPPVQDLLTLAQRLPAQVWKKITWRQGSRRRLRSRFALLPVWAAHGWRRYPQPQRVQEWLLIEWPEGEAQPTKYWLGHFSSKRVSWKRLVYLAHGRWRVELDYRELKDELGLDHYEGRHWLGWHHHVTLVSIAYAFMRFLQTRGRQKKTAPQYAGSAPPTPSEVNSIERLVPLVPDSL